MADTLYADISGYQVPVDDSYPHQFLAIKSNDGDVRDPHFAQNFAWAGRALGSGRLVGLIVYFVWRQDWRVSVDTHKDMCGARPHTRMATMIDVESWQGQITGNQSAGINAARDELVKWHSGDRRRVIGYGNAGDLDSLWPERGDVSIVLASYGSNPPFPHKIAHQFADNYATPPFGPCDINSADGLTADQFAAALGLGK